MRRNRSARRNKVKRHASKTLVVLSACASAFVVACVTAVLVASSWLTDLPDYSDIDSYAETGVTTVYASDRSTVLAKIYLENRIRVDMDDVSDYVVKGTVDTEDVRFYSHEGIDPEGILRAFFVNVFSRGKSEGASTITQQLVRNTVLLDSMSEISFKRKIREMYIALKVEKEYSKQDILNMYLNVINYGDGCYGIEAAAQDYFGKSAKDLSLSEAALLIGIPQSPTANNPRKNYDKALERRATVLRRMLSNGSITQEQYDKVIDKKPRLKKKKSVEDDEEISNIAPYYVDYIQQQLQSSEYPQDAVSKGGLSVYTTLDVDAQKAANDAIKDGLAYYSSGLDGSLVSINPSNGDIVAMVGGKDYKSDQYNLATQMKRQAGSSFKTFALLAALDEGVDPDNTYIDADSPALVGRNWKVSNSEGSGYGSMSLTSATVSSVNTVFARLAFGIGADKIVDIAKDSGVTADLEAWDSLALGAQGVSVLDMASGYATIAAGGVYHEPVAIAEITNARGESIYTHSYDDGKRVYSKQVANKATEILQKVVSYGTGTRASLGIIGQQAAGKTGTSQKGRDLWFCGFTPQYATAVWSGYREEKATGYYGGSLCAPIWRQYMVNVLEGKETQDFDIEDTNIEYKPSGTWNFTGDEDATQTNDGDGTYSWHKSDSYWQRLSSLDDDE